MSEICSFLAGIGINPGFCKPKAGHSLLWGGTVSKGEGAMSCTAEVELISTDDARTEECSCPPGGGPGGGGPGGGGPGNGGVRDVVEDTNIPPLRDTYVPPPKDTYVPPKDTYVSPKDTYVPPKDTYVPPPEEKIPQCELKWEQIVQPGAAQPVIDEKTQQRGEFLSAPLVVDLNGDGMQEIVFRTSPDKMPHQVFVFSGKGLEWSAPVEIEGEDVYPVGVKASCAAGDIDGDAKAEIACSGSISNSMFITAYASDGDLLNGWPVLIDEVSYVAPAGESNLMISIGNVVEENEGLEIIGKTRQNIYLFNFNGEPLSVLPFGNNIGQKNIALGDMDKDGLLEICGFNSVSSLACVKGDGTEVFSKSVAQVFPGTSVSLADFNEDGEPEIIIRYPGTGADEQAVQVLDALGSSYKNFNVPGQLNVPAAGSLGILGIGQKRPSLIHKAYFKVEFPSESKYVELYAYRFTSGIPSPHFVALVKPEDPIEEEEGVFFSDYQAIADIDSDQRQEILLTCYGSCALPLVRIYNQDGQLEGLLMRDSGNKSYWNAPAVGDVDGNGKIDIVINGYEEKVGGRIYVYECDGEANPTLMGWPMHRHDPEGTLNHEEGK